MKLRFEESFVFFFLGLFILLLIYSIYFEIKSPYPDKTNCPLKNIEVGQPCTFHQEFENYCKLNGKSTMAMNLLNCECNQNKELICLEDLKSWGENDR